MPLYEYQCQDCGRFTEKIQKFSDPELTECPSCGGRLERTLTAPAVQFKGSGWYKDLYSSAKPAAAAATNGETASSGSDAGTSKPAEPAAPATSASGGAAAGSGATPANGGTSSK